MPASSIDTCFLRHSSDRFRTAINVFGDSIGCAIVQHLSRKELDELNNQEMAANESNIEGGVVGALVAAPLPDKDRPVHVPLVVLGV